MRKIADRRHRAWMTKDPTAWDILALMRKTEEKTTIATCTKRGAGLVNELSVKVLFEDRNKESLGCAPLDWDVNPVNYADGGELKKEQAPQPTMIHLYQGMRIFLSKNMDKKNDFVNGMAATIEHYDQVTRCIEVKTHTGKVLPVHLVTEDVKGCGRVTYFPMRLGYASTVQRIQGMTLDHITLWLDRAGCRAAAYVAMSRVCYDTDYLIAGKIHPRCFVPAM